jgi:hypothetical protein
MTQYAYHDSSQPDPKPVIGWYDTELYRYQSLPDPSNLLEMSQEQWAKRQDGLWAVQSGTLVPYSPPAPAPSLAQRAATLLVGGLDIVSTGDPSLSATYPCDLMAQQQISAEVVSILLNGTFTDGGPSIEWRDAAGGDHALSADQFKALATAIAAFVTACAKCVAGQSTTLPSARSEIS